MKQTHILQILLLCLCVAGCNPRRETLRAEYIEANYLGRIDSLLRLQREQIEQVEITIARSAEIVKGWEETKTTVVDYDTAGRPIRMAETERRARTESHRRRQEAQTLLYEAETTDSLRQKTAEQTTQQTKATAQAEKRRGASTVVQVLSLIGAVAVVSIVIAIIIQVKKRLTL